MAGLQSIVMILSVCLFTRIISKTACPGFTEFFCPCFVVVAQSFFDDIVILPVLWIMSCFPLMGHMPRGIGNVDLGAVLQQVIRISNVFTRIAMLKCDVWLYNCVACDAEKTLSFADDGIATICKQLRYNRVWVLKSVSAVVGFCVACCIKTVNFCGAGGIVNLSPSLWHFGHLTKLYLRNNQLVSLPADVAHLSNLVLLDVSSNKLHTLPPELGDIVSLKELLLSNNHLRLLPFELGKLFQLQKLG